MRPLLGWTLLALLGVVLAAGVTLAASRLTSERVGLSAEPLDAGQALAPRPLPAQTPTTRTTPRPTTTPAPEVTAPPGTAPATPTLPAPAVTSPPAPATTTGDDHGGSAPSGHREPDSDD